MTRDDYIEKLIRSYESFYTRKEDPDDAPAELEQLMELDMTEQSYILMKKNVLWSADSHEYCYIFSKDHLTKDDYKRIESYVLEDGLKRIHPGKGHKCSVLSVLIVTDTTESDAKRALKNCRIHKNFRFSLDGWMDMRTGLVELEDKKVSTNMSGHDAAKVLKQLL